MSSISRFELHDTVWALQHLMEVCSNVLTIVLRKYVSFYHCVKNVYKCDVYTGEKKTVTVTTHMYCRSVKDPIIRIVSFRSRTRPSRTRLSPCTSSSHSPCTSRRPLSHSRPARMSSNSSSSVPKPRATISSVRASVRCSNSASSLTVSEKSSHLYNIRFHKDS